MKLWTLSNTTRWKPMKTKSLRIEKNILWLNILPNFGTDAGLFSVEHSRLFEKTSQENEIAYLKGMKSTRIKNGGIS